MTTAVYFDLDDTLLEYTASFDDIFARTLPVEATEEMARTFSESVLAAITEQSESPYERAFAAVCGQYDLEPNPRTLATNHVENEVDATRILPSVRRLVEAVAAVHPTGILTNGDGRMQRRKLEAHELDCLVDAVVISNEVGVRKPERAIFEEAKRRLPADDFIYVGDTYAEDIVPARELGFGTVYVGDEPRPEAPVTANGTAELADVLLPLLKSAE